MNGPSGIVVKAVFLGNLVQGIWSKFNTNLLLVHPLKESLTENEQESMLQEIQKLS
jgi:hypothetical protein